MTYRLDGVTTTLNWAALFVALGGSVLSAFDICTGGCTEAHEYRLFGLPFADVGISFMVLLAILYWFNRKATHKALTNGYSLLLLSAAGAEVQFLLIQKYQIGIWCPICVSIAAAIGVLALTQTTKEIFIMQMTAWRRILKTTAFSVAMIAGFVAAFVGVQSPAAADIGADIWFGKKTSAVEVYFISDWYCSYCREIEPRIEGMVAEVAQTAKYTFMDYPVHKESFGIMPYHLTLLTGDKKKYMAGRKALLNVTRKKTAPTEAEIKQALAKAGVGLQPADFATLTRLAGEFGAFIKGNNIRVTPTVLVRNAKTGRKQVLVGINEIRKEKVLAAINDLGR